jgi:hypothetical protein
VWWAVLSHDRIAGCPSRLLTAAHSRLPCFPFHRVDVKHSGKRSKADDVVGLLQEWFPSGFSTSKEDYLGKLAASTPPNFLDIGRSISEGLEGPGYKIHLRHCKLVDTPKGYQVQRIQLVHS